MHGSNLQTNNPMLASSQKCNFVVMRSTASHPHKTEMCMKLIICVTPEASKNKVYLKVSLQQRNLMYWSLFLTSI